MSPANRVLVYQPSVSLQAVTRNGQPRSVEFQKATQHLLVGLLLAFLRDIRHFCRQCHDAAFTVIDETVDSIMVCLYNLQDAWRR